MIYNPWIVLNITANPITTNTGGNSQVTADLTHNSDNQDTSSQGHVPDGIPVQFLATLGTIDSTGTIVNGKATATFQAGNTEGPATVQAKVDDQTVNTTVTVGNPNSPPVMNPIGDKTVNEGQQLQFTVTGIDPDGDTLTYSATGLPTGAQLNSATGEFTWIPNYNQAGTYTVTFTVSDGSLTDSKAANITVINIPRDIIYISPTGSDTTGDGSQNNPYQTILNGINAVNSGGTVYLADGTYSGTGNYGITINKDLNIIGQSQTGTIIDAQNKAQIFNIGSGVNVILENLIIQNGNSGIGGAISNNGNLNITNCTIQNNTGSIYGGGIYNGYGKNLYVNSCNFINNTAISENGGAIDNDGILIVTNSNFISNKATTSNNQISPWNGNGGAILNWYGASSTVINNNFTNNTANDGGAISSFGTLNVTSSNFTNNKANYGGAISNGDYYDSGSTLITTGSIFDNNTAQYGGAIFNYGGDVSNRIINFNSIVGNSPNNSEVYIVSGTMNATNNWWGSNNSPATLISGNVVYSPWIILNINADPTTIKTGGTSQVTTDLTHNSDNQDTSSQGQVPDGIPVQYFATLGNIDSTGTIVNGKATATFKAGTNSGQANIQATVDDQTVNTLINILNRNNVYVSPTGSDTTGDGSQTNPYLTILNGINMVNSNGTVYLADGIYLGTGNYGITIDKDVNIIGESQANTIIDAQGLNRIFTILSGFTVTIQDLTIKNGYGSGNGAAINNYGACTVDHCSLISNTADGGAIGNSGSLDVSNSIFENNTAIGTYGSGSAIYNTGKSTVNNCTFLNNEAAGGTINNNWGSSMIVSNSTFENNHARHSGGAIVNVGDLAVKDSIFTKNSADWFGGAISNEQNNCDISGCTFVNNYPNAINNQYYGMSTLTVHFSSFIGNSISNGNGGILNATNNWWGSNDSPATKVSGDVVYAPWLVLSVIADPTNINTGSTSQITADLTHNSDNQDTSSQGYVPDGIPVQFLATLGAINTTGAIVNGRATAPFQAGASNGQANIQTTVDDQTVNTLINILDRNNVYVSPTGNDTTGDGSQTNPYQTILNGINMVNSDGTVYLEDGIYTGTGNYGITINKNLSIIGQSQTGTIMDAQGLDRILTILSGVTVSIQNLTFKNGYASIGGAIYNLGELTVKSSTFINNTATSLNMAEGGGAIENMNKIVINDSIFENNYAPSCSGGAIANSGTTNIENSSFSNNISNGGGAVESYAGTLTVKSSIFTNNTSTSWGGAIHNDGWDSTLNVSNSTFIGNSAINDAGGAISGRSTMIVTGCNFTNNTANGTGAYSGGGAIANSGSLTVNDCSFTSNIASNNGGAIWNYGTSMTVTDCTFINNTATNGGAISSNSAEVHFNRIIGNSPSNSQIVAESGTVNAQNNWWGTNDNPTIKVSGNVVYSPWIVLTITSDPAKVNTDDTSQVTTDLAHNSDNQDTSSQGHVPDGIPIQYFADLGAIGNTGTIVNGRATTTFQAGTTNGQATVQAKVDDQIVSTTITVGNTNQAPILSPIEDKIVDEGQKLQFTISGSDPDGDPLTYSASNLPSGAQLNSTTGEFFWTPTYEQAGTYTVTFNVSDGSLTDSKSANITVNNILRDYIYISPTGSDTTGDGSQNNPYQTILNGINAVNSGGTVYLADGTYSGTGNYGITINKDLNLIGQSQTGTIIDALGIGRIFTINSGTVIIQNLTLKNGYATGWWPSGNGGAILNYGTLNIEKCDFTGNKVSAGAISNHGILIVDTCNFIGNTATTGGAYAAGAIDNAGTATITNTTFTNNTATYGGAIWNYMTGNLNIIDSIFTNNSATNGGAIINHNICTITGTAFKDNTANQGGAIWNDGNLILEDSKFTNNTATNGGTIWTNNEMAVNNCTFNGNTASTDGGAIQNEATGITNIVNSTFTDNSANRYGGAISIPSGNSNINMCTFTGNTAGYAGGAISNHGTLNVTDSKFDSNKATYGGAIHDEPYSTLTITNSTLDNNIAKLNGGAIDYSYGSSTITNSTLNNNNATYGGAIHDEQNSSLTIANSTLDNNTATLHGGAIDYSSGSSLTITNSTLDNNTATDGGAILSWYDNTLTIINSTLENNIATDNGGAIHNDFGSTLTFTNSTLNNNRATNSGGAIYNSGTLTVNDSTFTGNTATKGGAIYSNTGSTAEVHFNRIVQNLGFDIYTQHDSLNIDNNWWGTNFEGTYL